MLVRLLSPLVDKKNNNKRRPVQPVVVQQSMLGSGGHEAGVRHKGITGGWRDNF